MKLSEKIINKNIVVGIVGLGYVGIPLMLTFARQGFKVLGFDVNHDRKKDLERGTSHIRHIDGSEIKSLIDSKMFRLSYDNKDFETCDAIIICVPTPLTKNREPDMAFIQESAHVIAAHLVKQLVILESTTYPGTTDTLVKDILENGGKKVGIDFHLAFSPEREDPGNKKFDTKSTPKIVGGVTKQCGALASLLYAQILDKVVTVSNSRVAEMVKLLENIFRSVNIALVNELKIVSDAMDINIWEVIQAASTKPFGYMPFYPGPGLGGHCIPVDPFYLTWKAREFDLSTRFIELAGEINNSMHHYVINKVIKALNNEKKSVNGSSILVMGVAYKKDIEDLRESPALPIIEMLQGMGATVAYFDPYVGKVNTELLCQLKENVFKLENGYDACLIVTDHTDIDYQKLVDVMPVIIDCRNVTAGLSGQEKIILA